MNTENISDKRTLYFSNKKRIRMSAKHKKRFPEPIYFSLSRYTSTSKNIRTVSLTSKKEYSQTGKHLLSFLGGAKNAGKQAGNSTKCILSP